MIAALGAARRAETAGLGLVACAGLIAAGALHDDAAALAILDLGTLRPLLAFLRTQRRAVTAEFRTGIQLDRAHGAASGTTPLTLSEQLRLSEATTLLAPRFTRQALRLRGQVLAAHSYERGDVLARADSPTERWERSSLLRR